MPAEPVLTEQQYDADEADLVAAVRGLTDVAANVDDLEGVLEQSLTSLSRASLARTALE